MSFRGPNNHHHQRYQQPQGHQSRPQHSHHNRFNNQNEDQQQSYYQQQDNRMMKPNTAARKEPKTINLEAIVSHNKNQFAVESESTAQPQQGGAGGGNKHANVVANKRTGLNAAGVIDDYGRGAPTDRLMFGYSPAVVSEALAYHSQYSAKQWRAQRKARFVPRCLRSPAIYAQQLSGNQPNQKLPEPNFEKDASLIQLRLYWQEKRREEKRAARLGGSGGGGEKKSSHHEDDQGQQHATTDKKSDGDKAKKSGGSAADASYGQLLTDMFGDDDDDDDDADDEEDEHQQNQAKNAGQRRQRGE